MLPRALVASAREFASSSALRLGDATTTETLTVENLVGAFKHHVGFYRNDDVCGDLVAASEDRSDRNLLRQRVLPRWFHSACRVAGPDY